MKREIQSKEANKENCAPDNKKSKGNKVGLEGNEEQSLTTNANQEITKFFSGLTV